MLDGVKLRLSVQLTPTARVAGATGQAPVAGAVAANCAASVPPTDTLLMVSAAVPVLVTVSVCEPEPPTAVLPNETLVVGVGGALLTVSAGTPPVPVPDRVTAVGLPAALWAIERFPVFAPSLLGVKLTVTVHPAPGASVAGASGQAFAADAETANCAESVPPRDRLLMVSAAVPPFVNEKV